MCGRKAEPDQHTLEDGDHAVHVFCCEQCVTGVLRTFAAHEPARNKDTTNRGAA